MSFCLQRDHALKTLHCYRQKLACPASEGFNAQCFVPLAVKDFKPLRDRLQIKHFHLNSRKLSFFLEAMIEEW